MLMVTKRAKSVALFTGAVSELKVLSSADAHLRVVFAAVDSL